MSTPPFGPARPTDFMANERTFLAYVRTSLSVMAFGFVISRFGLFLRLLPSGAASSGLSAFNSEHLGLAFAIFGCALAIFGSWRFYATARDLKRERFDTAALGNVVVGIATSLLGVAVILSLLRVL
jgi:putative membrane protein